MKKDGKRQPPPVETGGDRRAAERGLPLHPPAAPEAPDGISGSWGESTEGRGH